MADAVALLIEDGTLATLRKNLETVRKHLEDSSAGTTQLSEAATESGDFGGFHEAAGELSYQCSRVGNEVTALAGVLENLIEAIAIQTRIAEHGYDAAEEESLARLNQIGAHLDECRTDMARARADGPAQPPTTGPGYGPHGEMQVL